MRNSELSSSRVCTLTHHNCTPSSSKMDNFTFFCSKSPARLESLRVQSLLVIVTFTLLIAVPTVALSTPVDIPSPLSASLATTTTTAATATTTLTTISSLLSDVTRVSSRPAVSARDVNDGTIAPSPSPLTHLSYLSFQSSSSPVNNWRSGTSRQLTVTTGGNVSLSAQAVIVGQSTYCPQFCDKISCWPSTPASGEAVIPCFKYFGDVEYDTSKNASRICMPDGHWANKSNYDNCTPVQSEEITPPQIYARDALIIYYIGYGISLVALSIALWIFLYFKDLRCVRNTIHTNLMITYVLIDLTWIITATLQSNSPAFHKASCYSTIVIRYFIGTNFFWMFVEGLYLYILVVKTFSIELINIQKYFFIGYGLPAILIMIWAPIKGYWGSSGESGKEPICRWLLQTRDSYEYIYVVPLVFVCLVNIFFLGKIMYVLITKLRVSTTAESQQYRKAAKALLVLIPLLGITYLLVILPPPQPTAEAIFSYLQPILISIQGFLVAVLYCFMNAEVQHSVRHHFERWKTVRTLRGGEYPKAPRTTFAFRSTRYGEGMKLYRSTGTNYRPASCRSTTYNKHSNNYKNHRYSSASTTTSLNHTFTSSINNSSSTVPVTASSSMPLSTCKSPLPAVTSASATSAGSTCNNHRDVMSTNRSSSYSYSSSSSSSSPSSDSSSCPLPPPPPADGCLNSHHHLVNNTHNKVTDSEICDSSANGNSNGNNNNNFRHHRGSSVSFTTSVTSAGTSFSSASGKNSRRESSTPRYPALANNNSSLGNSKNYSYIAVEESEDVVF